MRHASGEDRQCMRRPPQRTPTTGSWLAQQGRRGLRVSSLPPVTSVGPAAGRTSAGRSSERCSTPRKTPPSQKSGHGAVLGGRGRFAAVDLQDLLSAGACCRPPPFGRDFSKASTAAGTPPAEPAPSASHAAEPARRSAATSNSRGSFWRPRCRLGAVSPHDSDFDDDESDSSSTPSPRTPPPRPPIVPPYRPPRPSAKAASAPHTATTHPAGSSATAGQRSTGPAPTMSDARFAGAGRPQTPRRHVPKPEEGKCRSPETEVSRVLEAAVALGPEEARKAVKMLLLKWHPDKAAAQLDMGTDANAASDEAARVLRFVLQERQRLNI
eukprot:TRINITY_DN24893_c0_g1_i1.p1 TRINITY_DN24893_c0_g1~~TRINITY_DN24893_c0_g1_i1.p1  ORF type:complete len:339 (+),score=50.63 TRINITY_DN24893_c0_g1_i1:42-1019(+)